jgi:hypothetical protein
MGEKKKIVFEDEEDWVANEMDNFLVVLNGSETGNMDKRYELIATRGQIFMAYLEILGSFSKTYGRRDYAPNKIFKEIYGAKVSCRINNPNSLEIRADNEKQVILVLKELGLPTDLSVRKDSDYNTYLR